MINNAFTKVSNTQMHDHAESGPLVDNGAPYSAIETVQLAVPTTCSLPNWNGKRDSLMVSIHNC